MATLFSEKEMEELILPIKSPKAKEKELYSKRAFRYQQYRYTIRETAEFLGIPVKAMKALRDQGELQETRSGGKVLFYSGDIRRFLRKCQKRQ